MAPKKNQAEAVVWDYLKHYSRFVPGVVINEQKLMVTFTNGANVRLWGADDPDGLRGLYLDGIVMDEVAQMKPNVWGEIIRACLTDRQGWALFIGTPKGVNLFSELYLQAVKGLQGWAADMKRWRDTDALTLEEVEDARRVMTPPQFAQEFECDFSAAVENSILSLPEVTGAQNRTLANHEFIYAAKILGVDVARYGGDLNVLQPRQGLAAMQPKSFGGLDTMAVAGQVAMAMDKWNPHATFVDLGGIGAGVFDRLIQLGFNVTGINFGGSPLHPRFENKRAEMWWTMADWVRSGGCLPNHERVTFDLTAPTYDYANAKGKFQLESKEDMRARKLPSTDFGDALALTFAFPVPPPAARHETAHYASSHLQHEYDPYSQESV
jgi:hypothetical protein